MGKSETIGRSGIERAVFIDRDGVVNKVRLRDGRPLPPAGMHELELLPGAGQAVNTLRAAGYLVIVVTNQPDVVLGLQKREVVEAMHQCIQQSMVLDDIKVCYHIDEDGCACRKPKPGMLVEAASEWSIDLEQSFMIGDRWRDIDAGKAAGCRTILVKAKYAERQAVDPDFVVDSLLEASGLILSGSVGSKG